MTKEADIKGNNALIAQFMGWRKSSYTTYPDGTEIVHSLALGDKYVNYFEAELKYHSSWDWLMPVVEKISEHHYPEYYEYGPKTDEDGEWDDCAYLRTFGMRDKEGNYMVRFNANALYSAPTLIEATWMAVVEFIIDLNSLSKTNQ